MFVAEDCGCSVCLSSTATSGRGYGARLSSVGCAYCGSSPACCFDKEKPLCGLPCSSGQNSTAPFVSIADGEPSCLPFVAGNSFVNNLIHSVQQNIYYMANLVGPEPSVSGGGAPSTTDSSFGDDSPSTRGKSDYNGKVLNIHVFTDSTGETTLNICRVTMHQFPLVKYEIFCWPFIKSVADASVGLDMAMKNPGIIVYTILPLEVIEYIKSRIVNASGFTLVPALEKTIESFSKHTGIKIGELKARQEVTDPEYSQKINAIQYAMDHDDGRIIHDLETADIVILGVSRTSKTPTSLYLAYRGFKVTNIPYFLNTSMPPDLYSLKLPIVVGLLIDPLRLLELRKNRELGVNKEVFTDQYASLPYIEEELESCRYLFGKLSCPVVDVTNRSVEEVSAHIMKIHNFLRR